MIINQRDVSTIVPNTEQQVFGVLWSVAAGCIDAHDKYDGVTYGTYARELFDGATADSRFDALVHISDEHEPADPRGGYAETLVVGARHFRLPEDYVRRLKRLRGADLEFERSQSAGGARQTLDRRLNSVLYFWMNSSGTASAS